MTEHDFGEVDELSDAEVDEVSRRAASVPADVRDAFTTALAAWRSFRARPDVALSSDTRDYATGPEYEALVAIGPDAAALVLEQLATAEDGFFLLPLLESWSNRDGLVAATAEHPLESQQSRARRAVRGELG